MDVQQVNDLQQTIVRTIVDAAPEGWQRLEFDYVIVGGYGVGGPAVVVEGQRQLLPAANKVLFPGADLQEAMFEPGKGTWLSMRCVIDPPGEFHFSFNYDEPVEFDGHQEILDSSWVREFKRHPRPWALIPDWNYVKRAFAEPEWAEQVAEFERTGKHTDS